MTSSAQAYIDLAASERPSPGEKFVIALQENSEMLGLLDGGRTFRFVAPAETEKTYQQENRVLKIVTLDLEAGGDREPRMTGILTYDADTP